MLSTWLEAALRDVTHDRFEVIDVTEQYVADQPVVEYLADRLLQSRWNLGYLRAVAEAVGWEATKDLIESLVPTT